MDLGKLQGAVEQVDREIAGLEPGANGASSRLGLAWSQLVSILALEPPRAMRACPRCGEPGMREATVCGYCWLKLVPPAAQSTAPESPRANP